MKNFLTFTNRIAGRLLAICVAGAVTGLLSGNLWGGEVDAAEVARINAGNALVRAGKYAEAIENYSQLSPTEASSHLRDYNLAVAHYRNGEIAPAKSLFASASTSFETELATSARYNLGNCLYAEALKQAEEDKAAAIESLREAIGHYRSALEGSPSLADARANIELANELIKRLKEEDPDQESSPEDQSQKQESDEQPEAGENDSDQESPESESDQQDENKSENDSQQEGSQQDGSQKNDPSQGGQQQESAMEDPSENENPQTDSSNNPSETQQPGNAESSEPMEDEMPPSDAESEVPTGELTTAADEESPQEPENRGAMPISAADGNAISKEEALKMLQAVRDQDMLRRLRREQLERRMHVPTERDW